MRPRKKKRDNGNSLSRFDVLECAARESNTEPTD